GASRRRGAARQWRKPPRRRQWASCADGLELLGLPARRQFVDELVAVALHDRGQVVVRHAAAAVGDAGLRVVVRAGLVAPLAAAALRAARGVLLFWQALLLELVQAGAQDGQRARAVLELRPLVLAGDDDAGGEVRDAHRRVGRVDALAAGPARAVHVDAQVVQ